MKLLQKATDELARLRADLARFTGDGLLDCHAICDQRDAAVAECDRLRAEVERLKKQIKDDNRSYGCELRDPNGTIWEQAAKDYARAERAEADKARLDWLESPAGFDWQWNSAHSVIVRRAAIDAAMKP